MGFLQQPRRRLVIALTLVSAIAAPAIVLPSTSLAQVNQPVCPAQSDPNTPISVMVGDEFVVGLQSNRTTGYLWQLDSPPDPSVAEEVASVYVAPALSTSGPPIVGAGGRECWIFVATGSGQTSFTLDYLRPFDPPGTPPAQSATFTVTVQ